MGDEDEAFLAVAVTKTYTNVSAIVCSIFQTEERHQRQGNRIRFRRSFASVTVNLGEEEFKRAFRMSRQSFKLLCCALKPELQRNEDMGMRSSAGAIEVDVQVGLFLRVLANAQYLDIMMLFGISRPTVYQCTRSVCDAVLKVLPLKGLPTIEIERRKTANSFATSRSPSNPIKGCCGAIDGIVIAIIKPSEVSDPAQYWNRKGYYALPVQAVVDSTYRFLYMSACCVGSTHDSLAFGVSKLAAELEAGALPMPYHIVGDDAYSCTDYLLTPVPSRLAPPGSPSDAYNFFQSSLRMHVEQAFGQLLTRWRLLGSRLRFNLQLNVNIILAAMALHNFCADVRDIDLYCFTSPEERLAATELTSAWMSDHSQGNQQGRRRDMEHSSLREAIVADIAAQGLVRPG